MQSSTMIDRRVEVVATQTLGMKETAFGSLETSRAIHFALDAHYTDVRFNEIQTKYDLTRIVDRKPDLVVLCVKYIIDIDTRAKIWLSDYFFNHGIAYTGSARNTLEYDSDKAKAKLALQEIGIPTAKFFIASLTPHLAEAHLPLPFPLFVKPQSAANGNGIDDRSIVHDFASYREKTEEVFTAFGQAALVEQVLPGREFTVAILDDPVLGQRWISPIEIIVPKNVRGDRVLGQAEKSSNTERVSVVEEPERAEISILAGKIFSALDARDFGRIDIKMDALGVPHFMEANLVPGMTPGSSYFPRACAINRAMTYDNVVLEIVGIALRRADFTNREPVTVAPRQPQFPEGLPS